MASIPQQHMATLLTPGDRLCASVRLTPCTHLLATRLAVFALSNCYSQAEGSDTPPCRRPITGGSHAQQCVRKRRQSTLRGLAHTSAARTFVPLYSERAWSCLPSQTLLTRFAPHHEKSHEHDGASAALLRVTPS